MTEPARVLFVHHGSGGGGAANSLLHMVQYLDRDRYTPIVACNFALPGTREFFSDRGFELLDFASAPFVHTSRSWKLYTLRGIAKLIRWSVLHQPIARKEFAKLLADVSPDLVHMNGVSLLPLTSVARAAGLPTVQHVRESVNAGHLGLRAGWLRALARRVEYIIYICQDGRQRFPVPAVSHEVIYNPVPFDRFQPGDRRVARRSLGIPDDGTILFFPGGSMLDIKGIIPYLEAFATVRDKHSDVRTIIPGISGEPHPRDKVRSHAEAIIRGCGLESAIVRLPFTSEVERYYLASDIVVAPFSTPHFSRAVPEAGAMRLPVVGSRIGGIEEVVEDGVTGLLAEPGDAEDLAMKLCSLIEQPAVAQSMGEAGYRAARTGFDARAYSTSIMGIYDRVLDTGQTGL